LNRFSNIFLAVENRQNDRNFRHNQSCFKIIFSYSLTIFPQVYLFSHPEENEDGEE